MPTLATPPPAQPPALPRRKAINGAALPANLGGFTENAWAFAALMQEWLAARHLQDAAGALEEPRP